MNSLETTVLEMPAKAHIYPRRGPLLFGLLRDQLGLGESQIALTLQGSTTVWEGESHIFKALHTQYGATMNVAVVAENENALYRVERISADFVESRALGVLNSFTVTRVINRKTEERLELRQFGKLNAQGMPARTEIALTLLPETINTHPRWLQEFSNNSVRQRWVLGEPQRLRLNIMNSLEQQIAMQHNPKIANIGHTLRPLLASYIENTVDVYLGDFEDEAIRALKDEAVALI